MKVYVISKSGKPLMPTERFGKVRRLLKSGKAKVIHRKPFTIQLLYETTEIVQPLILGLDTGVNHIGVAVTKENGEPIFLGELETRTKEVSQNMKDRREYRKARRRHRREKRKRRAKASGTVFEKKQYCINGCEEVITCKLIKPRMVRFENRKRMDKWLTPTCTHLLWTHINFVKNITKILPIASVNFEYAKFDLHKKGYTNTAEYVLCRDGHTCQLCKVKGGKMHVHHVIWQSEKGGGINLGVCTGTIKNNIIEENSSDYRGGGIFSFGDVIVIENNSIQRNSALYGGGCFLQLAETGPSITDNTVAQNSAGALGGGIVCLQCWNSPQVIGNTITGNSANDGGGIVFYDSNAVASMNIIEDNQAGGSGGGIWMDYSFPTVVNNVINGNSANEVGGGICLTNKTSPIIINNTITGNLATTGGGISCLIFSFPMVLNTILWADSPNEIYVDDTSGIDITYSNIQGGWPGEGNIDADPLFVDPDNGDFHLHPDSPCIDKGTPERAPPDDFDGNPRDAFPDMGAYEYQPVPGYIDGLVTDVETAEPIERALIIAIQLPSKDKFWKFTDNNGYYKIDCPPGWYIVIAIKKPYQPNWKMVNAPSGGCITADFNLVK